MAGGPSRPVGAPRRRPGPAATIGVFVVIGILIGAGIAAVAGIARPGPSALPGGTSASLAPAATGSPDVAGGSAASGAPGPAASRSGAVGSVVVDPLLLAILPLQVGGVTLAPDLDTASQDAADPSHAGDLSALAVAVAVAPTSGDLAVASVVQVRPGVFSDDYFRSWRETFDAGACSQAGGVAGTAESTIAGHQTFIGHCAGGLLTYHVHLTDGVDRIVSISSLGPARFGEQIVTGLR